METATVGKNLLYQRKLKGLTQEELSDKTQVTVRTIQRIEKDEVNPHLQTIKLLAAALNVEVDELLILENPKEETIIKKWLLLIHGSAIFGLLIPLLNILVPLFIWIHKREDNGIYDLHGKKVINFQITMTLLFIAAFVAIFTIEGWGFFLFIAIIPFNLVVIIYNIIKSIKSNECYYPLSIPFLSVRKKNTTTKNGVMLLFFCLMVSPHISAQNVHRLDGSSITISDLNSQIVNLTEAANVSGIEIAIFNNSKTVYQKAFGYANRPNKELLTTSDVFYGASLSKAVFGYVVSCLAENDIINLDKPLQEYFNVPIPNLKLNREWREFKELKNDERYKEITARMCLSHTTGFQNWRWMDENGNLDKNGKLKISFQPGTRYQYSGEGMMLLQYAIEEITHTDLEDLAQTLVFKPLGMKNSSYLWQPKFKGNYVHGHTKDGDILPIDPSDETSAAGSMSTTLEDYSKFVEHIFQLQNEQSSITERIFQPNIAIKTKAQFGPDSKVITEENSKIELNYGLGWGLLNTPYGFAAFKEGHGEGFQHYSIIFPEIGKGVVIMSNSDNAESIFKYLLEITIGDIYTPWKWEDYIPYDHN